jgi:pyridoxine kinase
MSIVSIQSRVSFGHVGNSAAVFPLQRLGFDVWPVDTVQFSNHPGYGAWGGAAAAAGDVVAGLERLGVLASARALLTGYLGQAENGEAMLAAAAAIKAQGGDRPWLCDPVIGDRAGGIYVAEGIADMIAQRLLPAADVVTPNCFELELLSGHPAATLAEAAAAARLLLQRGPRVVAATGIDEGDAIACLAATAEGAWAVRTPRLAFPQPVNGAGDLLAALLLAQMLRGREVPEALSLAVSSLWGVLDETRRLGRRELALVAAQEQLVRPSRLFAAMAV